MMEKRSAHARPEQQMGEVMRYLHSPDDLPQKSAMNPAKGDGSVGTTSSRATHQWRGTPLGLKFEKCRGILQQRTPFFALFMLSLSFSASFDAGAHVSDFLSLILKFDFFIHNVSVKPLFFSVGEKNTNY